MLAKFRSWLNKDVLAEVWGSSWDYQVPEDKEQQLYDFYMIESLLPPGVKLYLKPVDFAPDEVPSGYDPEGKAYGDAARSQEDKIYYAIYEAAGKLVPAVKQNLLDAVLFSLTAEMRHVLDAYFDRDEDDNYVGGEEGVKKLVQSVGKDLGPEYEKILRKYIKYNEVYKGPGSSLSRRIPIDKDLKSTNKKRNASYQAMLRTGGTPVQWVKLAQFLYKHGEWKGAFGGAAWENIADTWLKLYHSKALGHMITWIDRIYDLQHNTDTVFNKVDSYMKDGGYGWLKDALDHKRDIKSPYEIIEKVSPPMKKLAQRAMWVLHRVSVEEFQKDKEKYDKEKQEKKEKENDSWNSAGDVADSDVSQSDTTVESDKKLKEWIFDNQGKYGHLPLIVKFARLAYRLPIMESYEYKVKKINELLQYELKSAEVTQAIEQTHKEEENDLVYTKIGHDWFWNHPFEYTPKDVAQKKWDQTFANVGNTVIIDKYDEDLIYLKLISHDYQKAAEAVALIRNVTGYANDAALAIAHKYFLRAIITGKYGKEYHFQGQQAAIKKATDEALAAWTRAGDLPLELRLARAVRIANYDPKKVTLETFKEMAKLIKVNLSPVRINLAFQNFLEDQHKEDYFQGVQYAPVPTNRGEAYAVLQTSFKGATPVKLDKTKEIELEALIKQTTKKISAIKLFREMTGWQLKASKSYIEYLFAEFVYLGAKITA